MSKVNKTIQYGIVLGLSLLVILALGVMIVPKSAAAWNNAPAGENMVFGDPNAEYDYEGDFGGNNSSANRTPRIAFVSPNFVSVSTNPTTITINGSNFYSGSVALIDGSPRQTNYIDSTRLNVNLNPGDIGSAGTRSVVVWNGPGGYSNGASFAVGASSGSVSGASTTYVAPARSTSTATRTTTTTNTSRTNTDNVGINSEDPDEYISSLAGNALYGSNGFMPSGLIGWLFIAIFILLLVIAWRSIGGRAKYDSTPLKHA